MIAFCGACRHAIHPPQLVCPECWNEAIEFKPVSGTGTVYSHTVNHQPWAPDMAVPFALAVVAVDGAHGLRVTAEVMRADPESVALGPKVRATFARKRVNEAPWATVHVHPACSPKLQKN